MSKPALRAISHDLKTVALNLTSEAAEYLGHDENAGVDLLRLAGQTYELRRRLDKLADGLEPREPF